MKRIISVFCVIFILLSFPLVSQANSSVMIGELGFSVSLPDELSVFTQNTDPSSSMLALLGISSSEFVDYLKNNDIYLDALAPDGSYEIVIIGRTGHDYSKIYNFNLYEDDWILKLFSGSDNGIANDLGLVLGEGRIYKTGNLKYYSSSGTLTTDGQTSHIKTYLTVVNGIGIQISLHSYAGRLSSQQRVVIKRIVDSVHFTKILSKPASSLDIDWDSILYKAMIAGVSAIIIAIPCALYKRAKRGSKTAKELPNSTVIDSNTYHPSKEEATISKTDQDSYDVQKKPAMSETNNQDAFEEIRQYKKLLDEGIITQEEFAVKKKQLLGL